MTQPTSAADVHIGDMLPSITLPPVNRTMLALFAGASGDHNPVHVDIDFARKSGMPDVFAHGMLGMAWLGRLITNWTPQTQLRRFDVRFQGITHLGNIVSCSGKVVGKIEQNGESLLRVEVRAINQFNVEKIWGEALIALDKQV
jgi:acyl dehydratase